MIGKKEIAAQFKEAAQLLDVLDEAPYRARAYLGAARGLDAFEGDLAELLRTGRLAEIRGVGSGLAAELEALAHRGTLPALERLRPRVPAEVREMFLVAGLGAKKIAVLWRHGIVGLEGLVEAAESGNLAALKGFGAKSAANVLDGARFALAARRRMRLDEAEGLAVALQAAFGEAFPEARLEPAGELRRLLETVGRLELVAGGVTAAEARRWLAATLDDVGGDGGDEDENGGLCGRLAGKELRLTPVPPPAFGAGLACRTGGDAFVAGLQARAAAADLRLAPDGLWRGEVRLETVTEEGLFERLGVDWVPPELREEAEPTVPSGLITLADVHGLIHNHSTWSDAAFTIRDMVAAARARGYRYLAMADHSRTSSYAGGLSIERLRAQGEEIREIREELAAEGSDFELLHGVEVDILPDGRLDYPDEVLAELDYTVVSVHQNFTLSREAQTERVVRAVRNPHAHILGHASGRLLLRRPPYDIDLERVIEACAESGTVIEINANPRRLDLDWRWLRFARERGCRFSIDPDAHHVDGFDDLRYGVAMARKGGLCVSDVVNTAVSGRAFLRRLAEG